MFTFSRSPFLHFSFLHSSGTVSLSTKAPANRNTVTVDLDNGVKDLMILSLTRKRGMGRPDQVAVLYHLGSSNFLLITCFASFFRVSTVLHNEDQ